MKNKAVITLLALTMTAAMLAGCGKKDIAKLPSEGTEAAAEISTETEKAVVVETETEESTEGAELVYNTETETEVVAKGEKADSKKTDSKTETKKDDTKLTDTKSTSVKDSATSTGSAQSSGNNSATTGTSASGSTSNTGSSSGASSTSGNNTGTNAGSTSAGNTSTAETDTTTDTTSSQPEAPKNPCPYPVWQVMDLGDGYVGYYCPDDVGDRYMSFDEYIANEARCDEEMHSIAKQGKYEMSSDYPRFGPYDDAFMYVTLISMKNLEE